PCATSKTRAVRSRTSPSRLGFPSRARSLARSGAGRDSVQATIGRSRPPPASRVLQDGAPGLMPGAAGQVHSFRSNDSSFHSTPLRQSDMEYGLFSLSDSEPVDVF